MYRHHRLIWICSVVVWLTTVALAQTPNELPLAAAGTITDESYFERYDLTIPDGELIIQMRPTGSRTLDTRLLLLDERGVIILENDDIGDEIEDGSEIVATLTAGDYSVIATRFESSSPTTGSYDITIEFSSAEETTPAQRSLEFDAELSAYPALEPRPLADWTILAYYGADTELEEAIIEDTDEFEQAGGSDSDVRVLVLLDRHPKYSTVDGDWSGTRLYEIGENDSTALDTIIDTEPLLDFGELDMGDPRILASFLTWGIQTFPADQYVVSFGSHGAGWAGVVADYSNGNSSLSMTDLRRAFDAVQEHTAVARFDLLINDACLMASIEYYEVMQDYFSLSIGSAELVTDPGLDMTELTSTLRAGIAKGNLPQVGRDLVDLYIDRDSIANSPLKNFTSSVTNLDDFDRLDSALTQFAQLVNANPEQYISTLTQARANTYTYNRLFGASDQIDLGDFMEQIKLVSTDFSDLIPAADAVLTALNEIRIYGNAGDSAAGRTSYYNIYFPLKPDDLNEYVLQSGLSAWEQMLINYFAYSRYRLWTQPADGIAFHEPQSPQISITHTTPDGALATFNTPLSVGIEVQATNMSRGIYYVEQRQDDDTALRLLAEPMLRDIDVPYDIDPLRDQNIWHSGVDIRDMNWNAGAFQITDGEQTHIEYMQQSFDKNDTYFVEGRYRQSESDNWIDVKATFTPDKAHEYDLRSSSLISLNASGTFGVFEPQPGAQLMIYRTIVDTATGETSRETSDVIYELHAGGLGALYAPVESGEYLLRFEVESFGQDPQQTALAVEVDNDTINPTMRGQNFIEEFGFTAGVPVWWGNDFTQSAGFLSTDTVTVEPRQGNQYDLSAYLDVFYYPGLRDLNEARERFINVKGRRDVPTIFFNQIFVGDRRIIEFRYEVENRYIHAGATYDAARDMALIFSVDDQSGNREGAETLFYDFIDTLQFYPIPTYQTAGKWRYTAISMEQTAAIPAAWVRTDDSAIRTDANWVTYHSPDDRQLRASFTRVRDRHLEQPLPDVFLPPVRVVSSRNQRTFYGEAHTWQSIQYTTTYEDTPYIGRLYSMTKNDWVYVIRVEAPRATAPAMYRHVLHPLVSSVVVEDLYYEYDWRETVGVAVQVPNPTFADNPFLPVRQSTATGADIALFSSPFGDKQLEIYFVPGFKLRDTTSWFGSYWTSLRHIHRMSNFEPITVNGQEGIEFELDVTIDDFIWHGRYFAVYSAADDMLYIIGGRSLERTLDTIDADYEHLRDTIEFQFGGFDFYTSIHNRFLYDPAYAIDVDVWQVSQPIVTTRNITPLVDRLELTDDRHAIQIYFVQGASNNLAASIADIDILTSGETVTTNLTIDDRPALQIDIIRDRVRVGRYFAVYDEDRGRVVVVGVISLLDERVDTAIYERLRQSFTIEPFN